MLKKYIEFMKRSPLITATLCIVYVVICFKSVPTQTHFQFFIVRTMLCGAACFFLYQISGDKTLTSGYHSTGYVLRYSLGFLIVAFAMGTVMLISDMGEKRPLLKNPVPELLVVFLMYMSVGLFEELSFRAVINDAIIYKWLCHNRVLIFGKFNYGLNDNTSLLSYNDSDRRNFLWLQLHQYLRISLLYLQQKK